jgi:hypothetical protein
MTTVTSRENGLQKCREPSSHPNEKKKMVWMKWEEGEMINIVTEEE